MKSIEDPIAAQRGRDVTAAALAEVGHAGAISTTTGSLLDSTLAPAVLFRAWCLGMMAAGQPHEGTLEEWAVATVEFFAAQPHQQALWLSYFQAHAVFR